VTPEQIQAVAKKYLVESNLSVAVLNPLPMEHESKAEKGGDRHGG
jgi:predicted Zn-dependent peptidase